VIRFLVGIWHSIFGIFRDFSLFIFAFGVKEAVHWMVWGRRSRGEI
jgi:hypothetical protein